MTVKSKKDESCTGATDSKEKEQKAEVKNEEPTEKNDGEESQEETQAEEAKTEEGEADEEKVKEETSESSEETLKEPEDEKMVLVAVYPILYESHQYKVGDKLPASNAEMVEAWIEAETAKFIAEKPKKAAPASAQAGVEGSEGTSTDGKPLGRA